MREKIVLIGAGSATFTRGLVADLIRLGIEADVALVDVDAGALEVATRLTAKMIAARNAALTLTSSQDRRALLPGATVVICTVGVGGRRAWEQDVAVPRRHGIYMPIGDTVGPSGSSRALRMIPAMVAIAKDVLDLAPGALFFNYGNPMAVVCHAVHTATGAPIAGLCHGVHGVARYLATVLGLEPTALHYTAVGINHLTWFIEARAQGRDVMPQLRAIAAQRVAQMGDADARAQVGAEDATMRSDAARDLQPFSWALLHHFGAFPSALDPHVTEFFPQFFRDGAYYGKTLGVDAFPFTDTLGYGEKIYTRMQEDAYAPGPLPHDYFDQFSGEHEQVLDIVRSIRQDRGQVFSVNLPNTGQVPNLPAQAIVEAPAVADGGGLRAVAQKPLPAALAGTLATRYLWVETIVEAALEGSRAKFIQALVLDGAVCSLEQATALADDLLAAQAAYLPWAQALPSAAQPATD